MKRKLEIIRSLIHQPKVLFLDEPTLGLDVNAQTAVRQFLQEYNERYGATILLTSHYMADITALCDRVLVIHQGSLIYDGQLDGLLTQFAPYREVSIEFDKTHAVNKSQLLTYGNLQAIDGCKATFLVPADELTATVSKLLNTLTLRDLSIAEPPIEDVIAKVFETGQA